MMELKYSDILVDDTNSAAHENPDIKKKKEKKEKKVQLKKNH